MDTLATPYPYGASLVIPPYGATATVYRVEPLEGRTGSGLWYDAAARFTGLIHTLPDAQSASLPMGWDPAFHEGGHWISATDTLADLLVWFSVEDLRILQGRGYRIMAHDVVLYRRMNGHEAFRWDDVVRSREIPLEVLLDRLAPPIVGTLRRLARRLGLAR